MRSELSVLEGQWITAPGFNPGLALPTLPRAEGTALRLRGMILPVRSGFVWVTPLAQVWIVHYVVGGYIIDGFTNSIPLVARRRFRLGWRVLYDFICFSSFRKKSLRSIEVVAAFNGGFSKIMNAG